VPAITSPQPPALSDQLLETARFLHGVRTGLSSEHALGATRPALRPATRSLGYVVLRNLGRAEVLLDLLAHKKPAPPTHNLLLVALALLSETRDSPRYDTHTLVNQSVEAAKADKNTRAAAGFVNACLRRFLRERDACMSRALTDPLGRWNHPLWWLQRVKSDHPAHWQGILQANLQKAPLVLRHVPVLGSSVTPVITVSGSPVQTQQVGEFAWAVNQAVPVEHIDGFLQGRYSVQDSAAQLAAPLLLRALLAAQSGACSSRRWRILDACAAPGGKTTHLLEMAQHLNMAVDVTALDIHPERCERIEENLRRCGQTAQVIAADAAEPSSWWDGQSFDAILLDAPCTASGIVRRHPDVLWLRRASDIAQLSAIQARLLDALWPLMSPQAVMLYCTCSVFKAEGQDQVKAFLSRNTGVRLLPSPGHLLPGIDLSETLLPDNPGMNTDAPHPHDPAAAPPAREHDGFFYALLCQTAQADDTLS
jgi:16S rRNA (cytosine967-C5)-methyltransferase